MIMSANSTSLPAVTDFQSYTFLKFTFSYIEFHEAEVLCETQLKYLEAFISEIVVPNAKGFKDALWISHEIG